MLNKSLCCTNSYHFKSSIAGPYTAWYTTCPFQHTAPVLLSITSTHTVQSSGLWCHLVGW